MGGYSEATVTNACMSWEPVWFPAIACMPRAVMVSVSARC